MHFIYTDAVAQ